MKFVWILIAALACAPLMAAPRAPQAPRSRTASCPEYLARDGKAPSKASLKLEFNRLMTLASSIGSEVARLLQKYSAFYKQHFSQEQLYKLLERIANTHNVKNLYQIAIALGIQDEERLLKLVALTFKSHPGNLGGYPLQSASPERRMALVKAVAMAQFERPPYTYLFEQNLNAIFRLFSRAALPSELAMDVFHMLLEEERWLFEDGGTLKHQEKRLAQLISEYLPTEPQQAALALRVASEVDLNINMKLFDQLRSPATLEQIAAVAYGSKIENYLFRRLPGKGKGRSLFKLPEEARARATLIAAKANPDHVTRAILSGEFYEDVPASVKDEALQVAVQSDGYATVSAIVIAADIGRIAPRAVTRPRLAQLIVNGFANRRSWEGVPAPEVLEDIELLQKLATTPLLSDHLGRGHDDLVIKFLVLGLPQRNALARPIYGVKSNAPFGLAEAKPIMEQALRLIWQYSPEEISKLLNGPVQNIDVVTALATSAVSRASKSTTLEQLPLWLSLMGVEEDQIAAQARPFANISPNTLSSIFALGLEISQLRPLPFRGHSIPAPETLVRGFTALRDLMSITDVKDDDLNQLLGSPNFAEAAENAYVEAFSRMFATENLSITYESFMALKGRWGDLSPVSTLLSRFRGRPAWLNEIPLLASVMQAGLDGTFKELKFGAGDQQVSFLSQRQLDEWTKVRSRLDLWRPRLSPSQSNSGDAATQGLRDHLATNVIPHLREAAEGMAHHDPDAQAAASPDEILSALLDAREAPATTVQALTSAYGASAVIGAITLGFQSALDSLGSAETISSIKRLSFLLRAAVPSLRADATTAASFLKSLESNTASSRPTLLFTTTFWDPKLLLTVGDLADAASCQNYRTGGHIEKLLGYVVDSGVTSVANWVLGPSHFASPSEYEALVAAIEGGLTAQITFDAPKLELSITVGQKTYPLHSLGHAHRRHIMKLGRSGGARSKTPGLFLERAYFQPHPAQEAMATAGELIVSEIAGDMGAEIHHKPKMKGGLYFTKSRNPGGVYSDAATGVMDRAYSI